MLRAMLLEHLFQLDQFELLGRERITVENGIVYFSQEHLMNFCSSKGAVLCLIPRYWRRYIG